MFLKQLLFLVTGISVVFPLKDGVNTRIVNGMKVTDPLEFPYQVSVQFYNSHICGGAIINERFVLTSARCIHAFATDELTVLAGTLLRKGDEDAVRVDVASVKRHDKYDYTNYHYDLAILKLASDLTLNGETMDRIELHDGPIAEPTPSSDSLPGVVAGWGEMYQGSNRFTVELYKHEMYVGIDQQECVDAFKELSKPKLVNLDCSICGLTIFSYGGPCTGDLGSPLKYYGSNKLVGILSYSYGCTDTGNYYVFASTIMLKDFIDENTKIE